LFDPAVTKSARSHAQDARAIPVITILVSSASSVAPTELEHFQERIGKSAVLNFDSF
jgi:hypothetical protein